ncbi:40S ribosomal protein S12 [Cyanidioschyzon merolae strain 10D]|jgi:small subunit ribosomal protein S12e|uniref:40S ribosomal protein S12 n=1 Tax=Cyanidioschyzon merolae (strain NIES-3377 / 10D) TaxID=280699 RepID=M1V5D9_CYAM1|nr:40S ribosomal protein S12 [Cyanidioschyzon merolae strain 10D]BAM80500.1 40S ribosomal protein S12 [Cyanidioschyzon merolae strain 10D]|eukprot:XP_005536536.1 40S ribosomal protein S12 [Cyanidioschyzon merolae strain 10D]
MTEVAESVPEAPSVPALPVVVPEEEVTDVNTALRIVLRKALAHGGLSRGLRESVRALDSRKARLCVLAMSCDEPAMVKLVQALCAEHGINLICVPDGKELGEWAGLCKLDADGTPRKVVSCSCVVVKDFGEPSKGLTFLENYLKEQS